MIIIAIIYGICLPFALLATKSTHQEMHEGQWPIFFTFLRCWLLAPFFFMTRIYNKYFK